MDFPFSLLVMSAKSEAFSVHGINTNAGVSKIGELMNCKHMFSLSPSW